MFYLLISKKLAAVLLENLILENSKMAAKKAEML